MTKRIYKSTLLCGSQAKDPNINKIASSFSFRRLTCMLVPGTPEQNTIMSFVLPTCSQNRVFFQSLGI